MCQDLLSLLARAKEHSYWGRRCWRRSSLWTSRISWMWHLVARCTQKKPKFSYFRKWIELSLLHSSPSELSQFQQLWMAVMLQGWGRRVKSSVQGWGRRVMSSVQGWGRMIKSSVQGRGRRVEFGAGVRQKHQQSVPSSRTHWVWRHQGLHEPCLKGQKQTDRNELS